MRRKFLMVVPVVALLGSFFGFAASLDVGGIDKLGSGSDVVNAPDFKVTEIEWVINGADYTQVRRVDVTMERTVVGAETYDIHLTLKKWDGTVLANESITKTVNGNSVTEQWVLDPYVDAEDIDWIAITVLVNNEP